MQKTKNKTKQNKTKTKQKNSLDVKLVISTLEYAAVVWDPYFYLEKDKKTKSLSKDWKKLWLWESRSQRGKFVTKMLEDFDLKPLIKSKRKLKAKTFSECDCETQKLIKRNQNLNNKCFQLPNAKSQNPPLQRQQSNLIKKLFFPKSIAQWNSL